MSDREIPFFLATTPSIWRSSNPEAVCPKCAYLFRYAYRRKDGVWRIGAIPANSRLEAAQSAQRAQRPGIKLYFKNAIAGVLTHTPATMEEPPHGPAAA